METRFPEQPGFSGMLLVGFRKHPSAVDQTQRIGTVVVKRTYSIVGEALQPDANGEGLRIADQVAKHEINGEAVSIVVRENDIAPFKPEADLVILGFHDPDDGGQVRLIHATTSAETVWLSRARESAMADDPDTRTNLFGWEQRALNPTTSGAGCRAGYAPRVRDTGFDPATETGGFSSSPDDYPSVWPVPAANPLRDPLHPAGFNNRFYNAYRRCWKRVAGNFPYFAQPHRVRIDRIRLAATESITFRLPDDPLAARFHYHVGPGPDRESRWCHQEIALHCDTLVVEPVLQRAYLLWRGVWDFDVVAQDRYRRLEVRGET